MVSSLDLSFQLLKGDAIVNGALVDLSSIVSESLDPFLAVGLSLSDHLSLISSQSSLLSNSLLSSLSAFLIGLSGSFSLKSGVWIQLIQMLAVGQWVSLLDVVGNSVSLLASDGSLNLI